MKPKKKTAGKSEKRKFHPLRQQIEFWFIGLFLLSMVITTVINGLFLEHYYISKKTDVLQEAVKNLEALKMTTDSDGKCSADISDEMFKDSSENNLTWVVITADGQTVCSVGSNEDLLEARLVGYAYDLDQKKDDHAKTLQQNENYVIQQVRDRFAGMEYVESWGELKNGCYFLIRTPLESIRESVSISNKFYFYVGILIIVVSGFVIWFVTKRITRPISELTLLSTKMSELDFETKYQSHAGNEIDELGENFNRMSEQLEKTISELKSANNELQKDIENKERIDQMRQEFLNNVSHELKTPIALIQGYAEGLKEGITDDPESMEFYCDVIMDEANKMNTMVKRLLTLNQIEFGNDEPEMERFDINELIASVADANAIRAGQKNMSIVFDNRNEHNFVWADEYTTEEVLTNYISNALNHCDGKRAIEVRTEKSENGGTITVTVYNSGKNIADEDLERIWEKFYKTDKARTREYGGNGIGLSIVKAIMDSMGQEYGVRNVSDGVEFWFNLDCKS